MTNNEAYLLENTITGTQLLCNERNLTKSLNSDFCAFSGVNERHVRNTGLNQLTPQIHFRGCVFVLFMVHIIFIRVVSNLTGKELINGQTKMFLIINGDRMVRSESVSKVVQIVSVAETFRRLIHQNVSDNAAVWYEFRGTNNQNQLIADVRHLETYQSYSNSYLLIYF